MVHLVGVNIISSKVMSVAPSTRQAGPGSTARIFLRRNITASVTNTDDSNSNSGTRRVRAPSGVVTVMK